MSAATNDRDNQTNNAAPSAAPREAARAVGGKAKIPSRWVPSGYEPVALVGAPAGAEVLFDGRAGLGFSGRRSKPDWHYTFRSVEQFERHVDTWLANLRRHEVAQTERRAERKAAAQAGHGCKVGDIFSSSWGYDQTNVDYYQITELHGATMATVRRIAAQRDEQGWLTGECAPQPGAFLDPERYPPMRVRINGGERPSFRAYSFASAYLMRPTAQIGELRTYETARWSAYA